MLKYLLLGSVLTISSLCWAGGDAKNMSTHEIRVKADWNCKSAKEWCAEDQNVTYNRCKCAKRMCDASQRAKEAAERGYDSGADCKDGDKYCSTAKSSECKTALAGPRPSKSSSSSSGSKSSGGSEKKLSTHEIRVRAVENCKSAQRWCAEDQSSKYNQCQCAKRMCDASIRAKQAAELGYDSGAECKNGDKYCSTANSTECKQALEKKTTTSSQKNTAEKQNTTAKTKKKVTQKNYNVVTYE